MSKGNTWFKIKSAKLADHNKRQAHGGYARFAPASVEMVEASGQYYTGCNVDAKRQANWKLDREDGIIRPSPKELSTQRYKQGDLIRTITPELETPANRRDGGSHAARLDRKPIVPEYNSDKVKRCSPGKMPGEARATGKRVSLGQPLSHASYSYRPNAQWEIVKR